MNMFNDNNKLKHPAFHDEPKEKKKTWSEIWDFLFMCIVVLGLLGLVLFCIWIMYFRERTGL